MYAYIRGHQCPVVKQVCTLLVTEGKQGIPKSWQRCLFVATLLLGKSINLGKGPCKVDQVFMWCRSTCKPHLPGPTWCRPT